MTLGSAPRSSGSRELWAGALLLLLVVSLVVSAGPTLARGGAPAVPAATGLSKMILGLNAGPGPAQNVSRSHGVQYYRIGISFSNSSILNVNIQARTTGVDYLGILDSSSLGVVRGGAAYHKYCIANCNWTLSDWNRTVRKAVLDYPRIHEWEIWNEPYSSTQRSGYLTNASTYFVMTKSAYSIIKAHDKNDTVVCLGGSALADTSALSFTKTFWGYGASNYCDAASLHGYISGTTLFNTSAYERQEWPKNLNQFENVTQKPLWITEFGRQSAEANSKVKYSQQNQNYFLEQAMGIFENLSFVKRAYVFNLAGLSNPPANTDFGLLNATTLKPKIAWSTFLTLYGKSLSHTKVAAVTEAPPGLQIALTKVAKLVQDKIVAKAPKKVDWVEILIGGTVKIKGTGSVSYVFTGTVAKTYNVTAYDAFTGLESTGTITVT